MQGEPVRLRRPIAVIVGLLLAAAATGAAPAIGARADHHSRDSVHGQLIVGFDRSTSRASERAILHAAGARILRRFGPIHADLVGVESPGASVVAALRRNPHVRYAEPNFVIHTDAVPNDSSFTTEWGLRNTGQVVNYVPGSPGDDIHATGAWDVTTGSRNVTVAVLDTGVDMTHPDLAGNIWTSPGESCAGCQSDAVDNEGNGFVDDVHGWNCLTGSNDPTDDNGHGTHVAGILGAVGNNHTGIAGVNWQVSIVPVKFIGAGGTGTTAGAICSILYAVSIGANVMNASWGDTEYSQSLHDAIALADQHGALFVAAAGNDAANNDTAPHYPASYDLPNIISVAATDQNDARAWFSDYGAASVDLGAPGQNIYSTWLGGGYQLLDGTSMATPFVSGAAALVKAAFPTATALGTKALLLRSTDADPSLAGKTASGGRLDVSAAVHCSGAGEVWVESPGQGFVAAEEQPLPVRVIGSDCADPAGVTVTADVNGSPVALTARGDGLYTGTYIPASPGALTVQATATASTTSTQSVSGTVPVPITPGGDPVTVTTGNAGQRALLSFAGTAGERVSIRLSAVTIAQSYVSILTPDGSALGGMTFVGTGGGFVDTRTLPMSGSYTIVVAPQGAYTGSMTVIVYDVPDDSAASIVAGGSPVAIATTTPGQNAQVTFSGVAGRRVSLLVSGVTYGQAYVSIVNPDGSNLALPTFVGTAGGFVDTKTLPVTGTYTVLVNPYQAATGSATLTLYDVPPDLSAAIAAGGPAVTVAPSTPGQNARLQFAGSAGQRVSLQIGGDSIRQAAVSILNPDGSTLASSAFVGTTGGFVDTRTLPASGTYTVLLDPSAAATGSASLTLYSVPADITAAVAPGGASVTVATGTPGQNAVVTFTGTSGQRISLKLSSVTMSLAKVSILKPDGSILAGPTYIGTSGGFVDTRTLPSDGSYTIQADPQGVATGQVTLTLYNVPTDATATVTVGGAGAAVATTIPGQNARVLFVGAAGQPVTVRVTGVSYQLALVSVLNPDATVLAPPRYVGTAGASIAVTTPTAGTYSIVIDPYQTYMGSATVSVSSP